MYISALSALVFYDNGLLESLKTDTLNSSITVIISTSTTIFAFISLIYLVIIISKILFNSSKATSASIFLTISLSLSIIFNYELYSLNRIIYLITGLILCCISGYLLKEKVDL